MSRPDANRVCGSDSVRIVADDLGYGDLGTSGNPTIRTPQLDRLAFEGQKWTTFYVAESVYAEPGGTANWAFANSKLSSVGASKYGCGRSAARLPLTKLLRRKNIWFATMRLSLATKPIFAGKPVRAQMRP